MSVITTTTWDSLPDEKLHAELFKARDAWNKKAVASGLTAEIQGFQVSENSFTRTWNTEAGAKEFQSFITELAEKHGLTVTVEIE